MNDLGIYLVIVWTIFGVTTAGLNPRVKSESNHAIELKNIMEMGKLKNEVVDRDINQYWAEFQSEKTLFESKFDELICTKPEELRAIHHEMDIFIQKTVMAWHLKQEQLVELNEILHHENYTDTALAKGDETAEVCAGLNEYIIKVNASTHVFKIEVDTHVQEVIDLKYKMDTAPCPCEWAAWSEWSECSTTCEAGNSHRERVIAKEAINNGEECKGPSSEDKTCNEDVCCPVDCKWNDWEEWPTCPSGCPVGGGLQKKTRTRSKAIEAQCNGRECDGPDFEKKDCSREIEIELDIEVCKEKKSEVSEDLIACNSQGTGSDECLEKSAEIAFVVDRSGSMGSVWSQVKTWLEALVDAYKIDGITRKGGLVAWSDSILESATVFFTENKSAAELKVAIENIQSPGGYTYGGKALSYTYNNLFAVGSNPSVFREIIFISDGDSEDRLDQPAKKFHDHNIRVTAVALGNNVNIDQIKTTLCATCGDRFFINSDFNQLNSTEFLSHLTSCS